MLKDLYDVQHGNGFRFTLLRQMVYLCIYRAKKKGVGAYEILEVLKAYSKNAKPITVYRALEYLQKTNLITKIDSKSKFVSKKHNMKRPVIYMICSKCGAIDETFDKNIEAILEGITTKMGSAIESKHIEVSVICKKCKAAGL